MSLIIVIEDHFPNARMAEKLLTRAGYKVLLAEDGETGLTTVFENQPDLILIDLGLPDIDGQTVIGLVRQQETLKDVPLIAFTAWPPEEAHDMALRYGCDGVITKPINTRMFADQIGAFMAKNKKDESDTTTAPDEDVVLPGESPVLEAESANTGDTNSTSGMDSISQTATEATQDNSADES